MMPTHRGACAALLLSAALAFPAAQLHAQVRTEKVADGVWAVHPPDELRFDNSNSVVILMDDGVFVVDTQNSPLAARAVLAAIRGLTDRPVHWVLNTHWHGDHVQGNEVYRDAFPDAQFIAHATVPEDMRTRAQPAYEQELKDVPEWLGRAREALRTGNADGQTLDPEQIERLRGQVERRTLYLEQLRSITSLVLPDHLFDDTLTISSGRTLHLMHLAGHTRGDVAIWIPDVRVLVTGDLLDDMPYTGHGSPTALLETMHRFDGFDFAAMIPGHGAVRRSKDHLHHAESLFRTIVDYARDAVKRGDSIEATQLGIDLSAHREWFVTDAASTRYWPFFMSEAVRRAWEEAGGH
jgi:cyclase